MNGKTIRILLIEANSGDATLLEEMLKDCNFMDSELVHAERLSDLFELTRSKSFDVLLLDLNLPDSSGLDTIATVHSQAPHIPIVVLTGFDDEELGVNAIRLGAQDYLVKSQVDGVMLGRSIRYAIERHNLRTELITLSLRDELTGLLNRRGFMALGTQHLHLARRMKREFMILFADLDNMKYINDTFGHAKGDEALKRIGHVLKATFRQSDVIARVGGDEFMILVSNSISANLEKILQHLQRIIQGDNAANGQPVEISLSLGMARFDPKVQSTLEELIDQADRDLYR